jgi:hypothetical protein
MNWGDGNRSAWGKGRLHDHQYRSPGTYNTVLDVRDPLGAMAALPRTITIASSAPTAVFTVTPTTGAVQTTPGTGTLFLFRPGSSGDVEDPIDRLQGRWDWEGDGTWDTPWSPVTRHSTHAYSSIKTYTPKLEVRDTSGLTGSVTHFVKVNGLRNLLWDQAVSDLVVERSERHDYKLVVPTSTGELTVNGPKQVGKVDPQDILNLDIVLTVPAVAGMNLDLFLKKGALPDPNVCSPPNCFVSRSPATGGTEEICVRLPAQGTYYVSVIATGHTGTAALEYELLARQNVFEARPAITNCLAAGS